MVFAFVTSSITRTRRNSSNSYEDLELGIRVIYDYAWSMPKPSWGKVIKKPPYY